MAFKFFKITGNRKQTHNGNCQATTEAAYNKNDFLKFSSCSLGWGLCGNKFFHEQGEY